MGTQPNAMKDFRDSHGLSTILVSVKAITICVCCSSDYDFLLGCLDRNLAFAPMLVLDTTPPALARKFALPSSVTWIHKPDYGHGWKEFRFRDALNDAIAMAEKEEPDVICHIDADEYFGAGIWRALELAERYVVEVKTLHHLNPREALDFPGEWHRRLWPAGMGVKITRNVMWEESPHYNQNPQYHPAHEIPPGMEVVREPRAPHHHLHYALGEKANDFESAKNSIQGWPDAGVRVPIGDPWPIPILLWKEKGILPSRAFTPEPTSP